MSNKIRTGPWEKKNGAKVQSNVNIDPNTLDGYHCPDCGYDVFSPTLCIRHISALISPNGQEQQLVIPLGFVCLNCHELHTLAELEKKAPPSPIKEA